MALLSLCTIASRRGVRIAGALLVVALVATALPARAEPSETGVKAAFLYNFTKFVEWPASAFGAPDAAIEVCTLGPASLADEVRAVVADRTAQNRPVKVRGTSESALEGCHVLYVSSAAADRAAVVLAALRNAPVLTVGEPDGFAAAGGVIGFVRENDRIRFEINEAAAKAAGLKISAKLLALARGGG